MIYLKGFNESLSSSQKDELKDFCETSLAYLIDEGFEVRLITDFSDTTVRVSLLKPIDGRVSRFNWNEVKDYYIPFLQLLSRRYDFDTEYIRESGGKRPIVEFQITAGHFQCRNLNIKLSDVINDPTLPLIPGQSLRVASGSPRQSLSEEDLDNLLSISLKVKDKI